MRVRETQDWSWHYDLLALLLIAVVAVLLWRWLSRGPLPAVRWPELLLLTSFAILAIAMVRNVPIFCLLAVPILSAAIADGAPRREGVPVWLKYLSLAICVTGLLCAAFQYGERSARAGTGLRPGVSAPAEFLRDHGIEGPIWNDALIGGYMIFERFDPGKPSSGVFVDMRPEAYPGEFFTDTYLPMLSQEDVWQRADGQYHFNALVYSLQDGEMGIEQSILTRVRDDEWAPVYTDFYSLIFVRRTPANAAVIEKFLIPREAFR
jgi:hypothetical protein